MAIIGKLTKQQDGSYKGQVATLRLNAKLTMRPVEALTERGPTHRLFSGYGECGAAFEQTSERTGQGYLTLKFDDPTFAAPVYVAAFQNRDDANTLDLVWSRPREQD